MKQPTSSRYHCKCGNSTFNLVPRRVKGSWGMVTEDVLICTECGNQHFISPCNTNGLTRNPPRKEVMPSDKAQV